MRAHRGRHQRVPAISILGLVVGLTLMVIATAGAMLSPVLANRPSALPTAQQTATVEPSAGGPTTTEPAPTTTPTATPTPTPSATPKPTATTRPPASGLAGMEDEVLRLTNIQRAKAKNCPTLRLDSRLRTAARNHSADMARYDYFSHTGRDGSTVGQRLERAGYPSNVGWAENIAYGYPTPAAVMDGWMNSDGHRRNILNCELRALGVGAARDPDGRIYWTQDFGGR